MSDAYSGYTYTRYKRPVRLFGIILIVLVVAVVAFSNNLIFGFVEFSGTKNKSITINPIMFYVTQSQSFTNKSDAIAKSVEIKNNGGSGYLVSDKNAWMVIDSIGATAQGMAFSTRKLNIAIADETHRETITILAGTFESTFKTLCDYTEKYVSGQMTKKEIMDNTRLAYNNLVNLVGLFEMFKSTAWNEDYTDLHKYLTNQLFGLNLIWLDAGANFEHVLKNASCWVAFALYDFSTK